MSAPEPAEQRSAWQKWTRRLTRPFRRLLRRRHRDSPPPTPAAFDLGALLGDSTLVPPSRRPLDLERLLAREGLAPRGVVHLGAHIGNELETYLRLGCAPIVMVDANPQMIPGLLARAAGKPQVHVVHAAVTDRDGPVRLRVTNAEQSSSILPLGLHKTIYPSIQETQQVEVPGRTLDGLLAGIGVPPEAVNLLVMDIQGAELHALRGAERLLPNLQAVLTEFSLAELYEGCALLPQLEEFLAGHGLQRAAHVTPWHPTWGDAFYVRKPVVAMSSLGSNGKFANQLFQYLFLRLVARANGAIVQVPDWVGAQLYGFDDPPPVRAFEPYDEEHPAECPRATLRAASLESLIAAPADVAGIDFRGFFQFDTRHLAPHRAFAQRLFTPVPALAARLERALARLRGGGREVIAVHLRRGDYGYECFFRAPCSWYEAWVRSLGLDPERAVVYVASEEPEPYRERFRPFRTASVRDVSDLPAALDWLVDFEVLRAADRVAISNSSYSFLAAFLNERVVRAMRPSAQRMRLVEFDPADAPVLLRDAVSPERHRELASLD